ncbi:MAG: hypothetical protein JXA96_02930 [Sedimentisphaerales bacterium]|nr:hypothetical protein [Sedimentisphaerales bacterium]
MLRNQSVRLSYALVLSIILAKSTISVAENYDLQSRIKQVLIERQENIPENIAEEWSRDFAAIALKNSNNQITQSQMDDIVMGLKDPTFGLVPSNSLHPLYIKQTKLRHQARIEHYVKYGTNPQQAEALYGQINKELKKWMSEIVLKCPEDEREDVKDYLERKIIELQTMWFNPLNPGYKKEISQETIDEMNNYFHVVLNDTFDSPPRGGQRDYGDYDIILFAPIDCFVSESSVLAEFKEAPEMEALQKEIILKSREIALWTEETDNKLESEFRKQMKLESELENLMLSSSALINPAILEDIPDTEQELEPQQKKVISNIQQDKEEIEIKPQQEKVSISEPQENKEGNYDSIIKGSNINLSVIVIFAFALSLILLYIWRIKKC